MSKICSISYFVLLHISPPQGPLVNTAYWVSQLSHRAPPPQLSQEREFNGSWRNSSESLPDEHL